VNISNLELEILIYESAARSQEQCVARAYRTMQAAKETLMEETRILNQMTDKLEAVRQHYLNGAI
jgi:outer membrane protein TolC